LNNPAFQPGPIIDTVNKRLDMAKSILYYGPLAAGAKSVYAYFDCPVASNEHIAIHNGFTGFVLGAFRVGGFGIPVYFNDYSHVNQRTGTIAGHRLQYFGIAETYTFNQISGHYSFTYAKPATTSTGSAGGVMSLGARQLNSTLGDDFSTDLKIYEILILFHPNGDAETRASTEHIATNILSYYATI
jgi:hypothetical protein